MIWPWQTELEERTDEYLEEAEERAEEYQDTYSKASDVIDLAEDVATHEGEPEKLLGILEKGLSIASDSTGAVPLLSDYLTLLSHGAATGLEALDIVREDLYQLYETKRATGDSHEEAAEVLPPASAHWADDFRLRYELGRVKEKAESMEIPERDCDTCGRTRTVDKLYDCSICGDRVCNYCEYGCNEDGDDGNYCTECRAECTHDGLQYCEDHLAPCAADGKQYCESYLDVCAVGMDAWCLNHLTDCSGCDDLLCADHERFCDACAKGFGDSCLTTCEGCGLPYCDDCFAPWIEEWELAA